MINKFSIRDLERLSGIKAHTIRIWEQRYNLLSPERTDTNIRYYSNEDLKLILNVSLLNNHGVKISKIARLSPNEISSEVNKITTSDQSEQMNSLLVSMIELDEEKFEAIISNSILNDGFEKTVLTLFYPLMERIGLMWQTGMINPSHEHFISNLVRQKFIVAIDQQKGKKKTDAKKIVLYLPDGEMHELSLLFYNYLLRDQGHQTIYLGQSVPFNDLQSVSNLLRPDYVLTVLTSTIENILLEDYMNNVQSIFASSKIIFTGYQCSLNAVKSEGNRIIPDSPEALAKMIKSL